MIPLVLMLEQIQELVTKQLATSPAGSGLCLIGGFRYRLLDHSARISRDVDYHWDGDLAIKQSDIVALLRQKLLPEVKQTFHYDGDVRPATGSDADSPAVRIIDLAFWKLGVPNSRIELPIDITSIPCLDGPVAKTVAGTIYLTASNADMIESKVLALLNRTVLEQRDFCDLFMFSSHLLDNSSQRIAQKLKLISFPPERVQARLRAIMESRAYHIRAIEDVIEQQLDKTVAVNLKLAGGGAMILDSACKTLVDRLSLALEISP